MFFRVLLVLSFRGDFWERVGDIYKVIRSLRIKGVFEILL